MKPRLPRRALPLALACLLLLPVPALAKPAEPFWLSRPQPSTSASQPLSTPSPQAMAPGTSSSAVREYTVQSGDSLSRIAERFGVTTAALSAANGIENANLVRVGQTLVIPGTGALPQPAATKAPAAATKPAEKPARGTIHERMTSAARQVPPTSPFYKTTWLTYYGSPGVGVMGILGEFSIDVLLPKLRAQAAAYDAANGPDLGVTQAFHLIYGTATVAHGANDSHLGYLSDELVTKYIERGLKEDVSVILDVQIANRTPLQALTPAFDFLKYDNVHLALDPEFAMVKAGQTVPGNPIGSITAAQVNQVQYAIRDYMQKNNLSGTRILVVHQFMPHMIQDKALIERVPGIEVCIVADGFGGPWPKVSKYNGFMSESTPFTGFKLFYRWDEPLMNERQTLGEDPYPGIGFMDITPNLIIYQ